MLAKLLIGKDGQVDRFSFQPEWARPALQAAADRR